MKSQDDCKEELIDTIASNDEVQSIWSMLSVDIDDSFSSELLKDIIKLWVTIRRFSTVSAWSTNKAQKQTHKSQRITKNYLKYQ